MHHQYKIISFIIPQSSKQRAIAKETMLVVCLNANITTNPVESSCSRTTIHIRYYTDLFKQYKDK